MCETLYCTVYTHRHTHIQTHTHTQTHTHNIHTTHMRTHTYWHTHTHTAANCVVPEHNLPAVRELVASKCPPFSWSLPLGHWEVYLTNEVCSQTNHLVELQGEERERGVGRRGREEWGGGEERGGGERGRRVDTVGYEQYSAHRRMYVEIAKVRSVQD